MTNTAVGGGQWQPPLPPGPMPPLPQGVNDGQQQAPGPVPPPVPQGQPGYGPQQPPGPWQPMLPQGPPQGPPPPVYGQQQPNPLAQPLLQQLLLALGLPAQALGIPVVGEPAQARGVPAGPPAPAAPGAQVAAASVGGAVDGRGGRGMQDPNKAIRRIHDKVDGKASGPIYKGTSPGELSVHNNPVLFQDKIAKVLSTADGGIWALTLDRPSASGLSHLRPGLDRLTPLRREMLQEFIGDHLGTHDELTSTEIVEVPAIDGSFAQIRAQDVSATEWLRKLVREGMLQSGCREAAGEALNNIAVGEAEAWKAASRRLVLVYRAYTADPVRPHVSEAAFFWRYITEEQLTDLLERLVQLLLPSAFDQSGLQGVVHERLLHIQVEIRPLQVDYVNPTSPAMTFRAEKTEGIFGGMVDLMSTRKTVYGQPPRGQLKAGSGPSPRLASIGGESMAGVRQLFRQSRPDIAALLSNQHGKQATTERLAAMDGGGDGGGDNYQEAVPTSHAPQHHRGYDMEQQQEGAISSPYDAVAAYTNQAASTPGRNGVPFGRRAPAAGLAGPQGTPRGSGQGHSSSEGAGSAALPGLPGADAPRQERAAFLTKHRICFAFAFQGLCPRQECSFNHDPSLMPAGYFRAYASKKRSTREGSREVSQPKRRLYALSDEQADVVAAYFDEEVEAVGGERGADVYA